MNLPICETCGTQYAETPTPPAQCPFSEDERQYVGWNGQAWTTHEELGARHTLRLEDDHGLLGIGLTPAFAIDQRPLYLPTDAGNILWECVSLVTADAVAALKARGGVDHHLAPAFLRLHGGMERGLGRGPHPHSRSGHSILWLQAI